MKIIIEFFEQFQRRTLLIAVAALLLVVSLVSRVNDAYETRQEELGGKMAKLAQYQLVAGKSGTYKDQLSRLLKVENQVRKYFFAGQKDDKLASSMQLRIQALVAKSGMQAESIRPMMLKREGKHEKDREKDVFGEVLIKVRLAGSLQQFMDFIVDLYSGNEFFEIKNLTIKPDNKMGLKVYVELSGYYLLPGQSGNSGDMEI
jgi:hypothetical protein